MSQCDPPFDLKIKIDQHDLYFTFMILPYVLKTIWLLSVIRIMSHCDVTFDPVINCRYIVIQWFWSISWSVFNGWMSYFRIMSHCDAVVELIINVGHSDLYFMVQWYCLVSLSLFDSWMSYFWILSQCDEMIDLYFMVQWFCLIIAC